LLCGGRLRKKPAERFSIDARFFAASIEAAAFAGPPMSTPAPVMVSQSAADERDHRITARRQVR